MDIGYLLIGKKVLMAKTVMWYQICEIHNITPYKSNTNVHFMLICTKSYTYSKVSKNS